MGLQLILEKEDMDIETKQIDIIQCRDIIPTILAQPNKRRFLKYLFNPQDNLSYRDILYLTPKTFYMILNELISCTEDLILIKKENLPDNVYVDISELRM